MAYTDVSESPTRVFALFPLYVPPLLFYIQWGLSTVSSSLRVAMERSDKSGRQGIFRPKMLARLAQGMRTLKFRLMLLITGVLLLVVGMPVALFVYHLDKNYYDFSTDMLEITSGLAYQYILDGMMRNDSTAIQQNLELLALEPRIQLLRLYRPSGMVLYSSHREEIQHNVYQLTDRVYINRNGNQIEAFTKVGNIFAHHHPIRIQKQCTSCHSNEGSVVAYLDVHARFTDSEQIYLYTKHLSVTGGILIIVILWIATNLLYQEQIGERLLTLLRGFDELARENFNFRINMAGGHELALLANRFNKTVEKLKAARKKEEGFYQEQLERADRLVTLGEIAAEIAHEVNNPAGIILTRAEFVKDEMEEHNPGCRYGQDLDIIVQQTERIADVTRNILHYARKPTHSFAATDLNEVVRHAVKILQPRIKKRRAAVTLTLPGEPATIWGNFSQLEQVFCNLINNSLDAIPDGKGRIEICFLTGNPDKPTYRVLYQDNGPGIPLELGDDIFAPFFTTKEDGKGTGLGLFIARNIVNHHGGRMTLQASTGQGARFIIELERYHG